MNKKIYADLLNNRREHIKAAFHVDWMQMPDQKGSPNMTATEVVDSSLLCPACRTIVSSFINFL